MLCHCSKNEIQVIIFLSLILWSQAIVKSYAWSSSPVAREFIEWQKEQKTLHLTRKFQSVEALYFLSSVLEILISQ